VNGRHPYSARHLFDGSNEFICTDVNPEYGHQILDVTTLDEANVYDLILCLNVLEHVLEAERAVHNLWRALKPRGAAYIAVPFLFPLHDEPSDYWRFTEHSLRHLLGRHFESVLIQCWGARKLPFGYFASARRLS
jgi:2-polyprenyl-3-methyl-5-hydroxy-6-metoxy-1,4-benzoquinol methylase